MAKLVEMPKLSPTMEEGQLSVWHKNEGDEVAVDDLLAEVETDKATMEFRSFDKGVILKLLVPAGSLVKLGQPVAILGARGDDISALLGSATPAAPAEPKGTAGASTPAAAPPAPEADAPAAQPAAQPADAPADAPVAEAARPAAAPAAKPADTAPAAAPAARPADAADTAAPEAPKPAAPASPPAAAPAAEPKGTAEASAPAKPAVEPKGTAEESAQAAPKGTAKASTPGSAEGPLDPSRLRASPYVRKLAREQGVDLQELQGSGPAGRIVARDLAALPPASKAAESQPAGATQASKPAEAAPPARPADSKPADSKPADSKPAEATQASKPADSKPAEAAQGSKPAEATQASKPAAPGLAAPVSKPLSMMRKTIARRLTESKQSVPHFYLTIDVDVGALVELREQVNAELLAAGDEAPPKVSLNDLLVRACALALVRVPECNAQFAGDAILYHQRVDISVAVAVAEGLVTPVVRDAQHKSVGRISSEIRELAGRAKAKKLAPEEMSNGTFSISNLGMFGIDEFSAVINPPEGAILAVGRVRDEPVVRAGAVVAGKRLGLTLSCDHRVIDGAVGARFLAALRALLERPMQILIG